MNTLKSGMLAFLDSFNGMIPCRVDKIDSGRNCSITVTANRGPYRKGERLTFSSLHVAPRKAVHFRKYSTTITRYEVQPD